MSSDPRRLAALVVNYDSGAFCVRCVESLAREWAREGRDPRGLEIVVIDNASPKDQEPYLKRCEAAGATVIRSAENHGYSGGMNRCLERTHGGPEDVVAVLNPDLYFLPGNVATLMGYLADHPECGVVAPRAAYEPVCREILLVDTPGLTAGDPSRFVYRHRRVPLYPLERDFDS